jgi:putative sigma-54 modulation protein
MRIEVTGLNVAITDELREQVDKRFEKLGRMVSDLATLDVILSEEKNPSIAASQKAEGNLHVKGATLNAKAATGEMRTAISEVAEELQRQVRRRQDKTRPDKKGGTPSIRYAEAVAEAPETP